MIVHTYGPAWDCIDLSPNVVKLSTWLRLAGQPFEARVSDVRRTPNQKLPAVTLTDGQVLADSAAIIGRLSQQLGDPLGDARLSADQLATQRALQALLESDLYFASLWRRWVPEAGWVLLQPEIERYLRGAGIPAFVTGFVAGRVRAQVIGQLKAQGMGRRSQDEIDAIALSAWQAVAHFLGDQPFIFGAQPCSFDATVFAFVHTQLGAPFDAPAARWVQAQPALRAYHDRMLVRYWPERVGRPAG
jgi:glutathione S-transferase